MSTSEPTAGANAVRAPIDSERSARERPAIDVVAVHSLASCDRRRHVTGAG